MHSQGHHHLSEGTACRMGKNLHHLHLREGSYLEHAKNSETKHQENKQPIQKLECGAKENS